MNCLTSNGNDLERFVFFCFTVFYGQITFLFYCNDLKQN